MYVWLDRSNGMLNCGNGKKALREFSAFFILFLFWNFISMELTFEF